ncbi:hypothetical protein MASR1M6_32840 [Rubrivivax sp.]
MEIRVEGLVKHYRSEGRTVKALDRVDLHIPSRSIFTLLGPSGCGKTTLLRCIVGLETPDDGEIRIGDQLVWSRRQGIAVPTEKRGLGMVFQSYAIWPHMTVFDNVAYPLQVRGVARAQIEQRTTAALRFVQLEGYGERPATRLSGGQQQRVALARALVAEPGVILFDEPLSNLDAKLREETRKELKRFLGTLGITAVYVTHDRVEALALSDTIAVMQAGRVVEVGTPRQIYFDAGAPVRRRLHRPRQPAAGHRARAGRGHDARRLRARRDRLRAARAARRQRGDPVPAPGVPAPAPAGRERHGQRRAWADRVAGLRRRRLRGRGPRRRRRCCSRAPTPTRRCAKATR